jgi:hypothetical protein
MIECLLMILGFLLVSALWLRTAERYARRKHPGDWS